MAEYDDDDDRDRDDDLDIGRKRGRRGSGGAAARLNGPAIALMVVTGLHMFLMLCLGLPINILQLAGTIAAQNQGMDFGPIPNIIWIFISVGIQAFILFGAFQMQKGQSYGICMATAVLSVIPCLCSSCYIFGIPFGIWALIVLMDQEVKDSFKN